jgi:hypothetical protein
MPLRAPDLRSQPAFQAPPAQPASAPPAQVAGAVRLRYLARAPILVRGARSGQSYRFSETQPVLGVQRADAELLLATGHFRREG